MYADAVAKEFQGLIGTWQYISIVKFCCRRYATRQPVLFPVTGSQIKINLRRPFLFTALYLDPSWQSGNIDLTDLYAYDVLLTNSVFRLSNLNTVPVEGWVVSSRNKSTFLNSLFIAVSWWRF